MNFLEAVKKAKETGCLFKIKDKEYPYFAISDDSHLATVDEEGELSYETEDYYLSQLDLDSILSDNWEVIDRVEEVVTMNIMVAMREVRKGCDVRRVSWKDEKRSVNMSTPLNQISSDDIEGEDWVISKETIGSGDK